METKGYFWLNPPQHFQVNEDTVSFMTVPNTDFWQRTHYGFQNDNGHCFVKQLEGDFTLLLRAQFSYRNQYDQCGVIVYMDSDNWCKASIELFNTQLAYLGSVVTNLGYSDWATNEISPCIESLYWRIHRRGNDFMLEHSNDGLAYQQLRIFHLHAAKSVIAAGAYACSPLESSFHVKFSELFITGCMWESC